MRANKSFQNKIKVITRLVLTFFFIVFIITLNIFSQVTEEWVARYNGPGNGLDYAHAIVVDSLGNVYITGESSDSGIDYTTIKYDSAGVQQWVARYNGPGNDYDDSKAIALDSLGNVYVTGQSYGSGTHYDYATIKYNTSGIEQWVARYNGPGNEYDSANAIAVDSLGNVYVTGESLGSGTFRDYATIKYNNAGIQQWVARYNGPGNSWDWANAIAIDNSGNVYVTGLSDASVVFPTNHYHETIKYNTADDYLTIKYNSAGVKQWVARYNGLGNSLDEAVFISVDSSGNVYVTGESWGSGTYDDYATIKYNSLGIQQWVARYNGPENHNDGARAINLDSSGNVYVTGTSDGSGTSSDYATIKYNSLGIQQWVARYNGPGNSGDRANAIAVDSYENVYVIGMSGSETSADYATIKYNSSGIQQWVARYNGFGNSIDRANAIAIDSSGNVYITGESEGSGTSYDYATVKYSQGTSISNCIWALY